ncbi:MAG: hypothetical protein ACM3Y8_01760 [Byssovorax cruenta]|jgi:hypothetical protein
MRKTTKLLAVLVLLLVTFSPQAAASAEGARSTWIDNVAFFESIDPSGCIHTSVGIETGAEYLYSISIFQYDSCQSRTIIDGYGNKPLTKSEIHYTGNLGSTRLETTVQVIDFERNLTWDIWLDVTWTGIGEINEYHDHQNYSPSPGCHVNYQVWDQYRSASVSGTVSDGTTNFLAEPGTYGDMQFTKIISTSQGCE